MVFRKISVVLFAMMLVLCLASIMPGVSTAGVYTESVSVDSPSQQALSGFMCDMCNGGDSWWCAGCLGITHQQEDDMRYHQWDIF